MENATKALLIAAGVLIVILLITFGMNIFNSTGDTSADAKQVGEEILLASMSARTRALLSMMDISNEQTFADFIKTEYPASSAISGAKVKELVNIVIWRIQKLEGKIYSDTKVRITGSQNDGAATNLVYCYGNQVKGLNLIDDNKTYYLIYSKRNAADIHFSIKVRDHL